MADATNWALGSSPETMKVTGHICNYNASVAAVSALM